jgi:hypothetical protein
MQNFNKIAAEIGCRARIKGNKKNIQFYEVIGINRGYETIVKIDMKKFSVLIQNFPQLH